MLSLRYNPVQSSSNCHFFLESDFESSSLNLNNLLVTAYLKDHQLNNFVCISPQTIQSSRFVVGCITAMRAQNGFLRASVDFNADKETEVQQNRHDWLFAEHSVTITLLQGSLKSQSMLHAIAHFDVTISQDSDPPPEDCRRYFDVRLFKQVEKLPEVLLPKKCKDRKHYVVETDDVDEVHSRKKFSKNWFRYARIL